MFAQTSGDRELAKARENLESIRRLVDEGVAPPLRLKQAEEALADAEDAVVLQHTLYGADLTEAQSEQMLAATQRRFDRRQKKLDAAKMVVEEGGASRLSLQGLVEDLDYARRELDMANSRARLVHDLAEMARAEQKAVEEQEKLAATGPLLDRFDGNERTPAPREIFAMETAFEAKFARPLPVSARGDTALHRALGFDHRDRVDVALHPDEPEGVWLRRYLVDVNIPFFSFRSFVPGRATAAHIHIGPQSTRIARVPQSAGSGL